MSTGTRRYKAWLRDIVGIFQDDRLVLAQKEMTMEGDRRSYVPCPLSVST